MGTFLQDLKFGARLLAKAPGFTAIAALSLALGIGANTAIFTLINAVLLNPLPVEDPSQLVSVFTTDERNQNNGQPASHHSSACYEALLRHGLSCNHGPACHWLTLRMRSGFPAFSRGLDLQENDHDLQEKDLQEIYSLM
jgi:hypothetical protein